jgi:hypothetical protein
MDQQEGRMNGIKSLRRTKALLVIGVQLTVLALAALTFAGEGKKIATVTIPPAPELYATEPQPLTVSQCGQCHPGVFRNLKNDGTKHRFDCQKCHTAFHAYNPKKGGWDALMPKCSSCHAEPHGKQITDCASCHSNPHAPKKVAMDTRLINACPTCHAGPQEQLVKFPSKHAKVGCQKCHTSHGYIPSCFNCHKPHHAGQELATCTKCHPVHRPLQIAYEKDVPAVTCGSCHGKVYAKWQKTGSKHAKVNCATCHHSKHRYVPQCTECHAAPHKKEILSRFPRCLNCHLDVHDLPTDMGMKKPK